MSRKPISRRRFLEISGATVAGTMWVGRASQAGVRDTKIVRAAIHPGIGIARVGNSPSEYYIGPEVTTPSLILAGQMRDKQGALKRQAARFRIYGYNAAGEVVAELTSTNAQIEWRAHLANKKAAWYRFLAALDIPESRDMKCPLRNPGVARSRLVIDPGERAIAGRSRSGKAYKFDTGRIFGRTVYLGELRTDKDGRLLVLGGFGTAESPGARPVYDPAEGDTFNNADGWYDDIADGPVDARVKIGGREIPVEGAWVAVAPPNYAPDVIGWRTMYELLVDSFVAAGRMRVPEVSSFTEDILPVLHRLTGLQWVNKGFADLYGKGTDLDFADPARIGALAGKSVLNEGVLAFRNHIYRAFRLPGADPSNKRLWPMIYGDAFGTYEDSPRVDLFVSDLRALHLKRWVDGQFVNDWDPRRARERVRRLEDLPVSKQPAMLDKSALHFCLADAFHPGCELTWPMRHVSMFESSLMSSPFRIKRRPAGGAERDYGAELTAAVALSADGPLHGQGPGDLTKWMAVPWQGDTIMCRSGYDPKFDPYLPTFWPARVPNQVLSEADYKIVMDESRPREERLAAFKRREHWVRRMRGSAPEQILQSVAEFGDLGVIEARRGVKNDPELPEVMLVETLSPSLAKRGPPPTGAKSAQQLERAGGGDNDLYKAGWESEEQLEEFRRLRGFRR